MYGWNQTHFQEKQLNKPNFSTALGLTHLNAEELQACFNGDEKFESAVKDLKQLKDIEAEKEMVMASNLSLAEFNLVKEPNYKKRKQEIQLLMEECKRLLNNIETKSKELAHRPNESVEISLALLKTATAEVEEESEKLATKFLDGAMDAEDFLKEFSSHRKMMHLRRVKADKMSEMLVPKTTFCMSSSAERVLTFGESIFDTAASSAQAFSSNPVFYPSLNCAFSRKLAIDIKPMFGSKPIFGSKPLFSSKPEFNRRPVLSSHLHYGNKQQFPSKRLFRRKLGLNSKPVYGGNVFCYKPSFDRMDFTCRPAIYSKPRLHNSNTARYSNLRSRGMLNFNSNLTVHGSSGSSDFGPNSRTWALPTAKSGQSTRSSISVFGGSLSSDKNQRESPLRLSAFERKAPSAFLYSDPSAFSDELALISASNSKSVFRSASIFGSSLKPSVSFRPCSASIFGGAQSQQTAIKTRTRAIVSKKTLDTQMSLFNTNGVGLFRRFSTGRPARQLLRSPRLLLQPRPAERIVCRLSVCWQWVLKKFKRQRLPAIAF